MNNRSAKGPGAGRRGGPADEHDLYRTIFDNAGVAILQSTPAGRYVLANAKAASLLGYDSPEQLIREITDVGRQLYVNPAQRAELAKLLERDGRVDGFLAEVRRRDGTTLWGSTTAVTLRDAGGRVTGYLGTTQDVTDLVRAQQQLSRAAADFHRVFENAAEGMYQSTPDGRQLRANPALVRLNGYASEAEMLKAINDIAEEWYVDPGRRTEFKRLLERDGTVRDFESEVYRHKTRERIWVSENSWVVRDAAGRALFYEGTVVDITKRKNAERALQESEQRFRDYAEVASDWFWETGLDHRFTFMSGGDAGYGFSNQERIGRTRWEIAADLEEDPEKWEAHRALLERHEPFRDFVYRSRLPTGAETYNAVSGKPLFDPRGRFLGYRGTARDVTATVMADERLRVAMHEAEEANQAKISFLANMSHELRTPLNAILGFAEVIRDRMYGPNDPRYSEYAKFICESGQHLLTLISDILDMAKMDAGRLELYESEIDLVALVGRQAELLSQRAQDRGVALTADLAPLPAVRADEVRMRQIMLNLLGNAVKFTPKGGRVEVRTATRPDGGVAVVIADTGIGMTQDEIATALQPFRQVDADVARRNEGTGLGLPITKNLVELHGGQLLIESEKDQGTTVTVVLPAARVAASAAG